MPYYKTTLIELNGVGSGSVVLAAATETVVVQAGLFTNTGFAVLVGLAPIADNADTDQLGILEHKASMQLFGVQDGTVHVRCVNAAGANANGGAEDYVIVRESPGMQST